MVIDHIMGYPTDSGLRLALMCTACNSQHKVTLSKIGGRYAYRCGDTEIGGFVTAWQRLKGHARGTVIVGERAGESQE